MTPKCSVGDNLRITKKEKTFEKEYAEILKDGRKRFLQFLKFK